MWRIPLFKLDYDESEFESVMRVLKSQWLTAGDVTSNFENEFASYLGKGVRATAVSSGTAALHLSLLACGIKRGDEVMVSGLSFVAGINVVEMVGAKSIWVDCTSHDDWNLSVDDIKKKMTDKVKAIVLVHYAGYPCNMEDIMEFARSHGVHVIEDVAHAVGAEYCGKKCGTIGDIGCFSFFSNKNLSTGEGGMVVTCNDALQNKLVLLRSHGMTSLTIERYKKKGFSYDVMFPGLNYRLDEIRSALGRAQLNKLDRNNKKRCDLTLYYKKRLMGIGGISVPWKKIQLGVMPSYHIFPVLLDASKERIRIMEAMREKGIQTSIHYPSYSSFSYYKDYGLQEIEVADDISKRVLTLPLYPSMANEEVDEVCRVLKESLEC